LINTDLQTINGGSTIVGWYTRDNKNKEQVKYNGIAWGTESELKKVIESSYYIDQLYDLGWVSPDSWENLAAISGQQDLSIRTISNHLIGDAKYLNYAGYTQFPDGTYVTREKGKYILINTDLQTINGGSTIVGWYTRDNKNEEQVKYNGIAWGTESEFKKVITLSKYYVVGKMIFNDIDICKSFFEELKNKTIKEPWAYKGYPSEFKYPILKSYLMYEVDRLFYEYEVLQRKEKIRFNESNNMIWLNTNLINAYGKDLCILGKKTLVNGDTYISDLEIHPSKTRLSDCGFNYKEIPSPPQFFDDINEIVFHSSWDIDDDMDKLKHIIEERIERFPKSFRGLSPEVLGKSLNDAVVLAKSIAQRNYKFIVPMYYPTRQRIQLLMPIYLNNTYSNYPDFALVLTPKTNTKLYIPETILGLNEVYQNARLIAKPEQSWFNRHLLDNGEQEQPL
ncbi:MAG: DUF3825 domain-containing protein, partial [Muribaculaceae bacterium]|nr:DUF3825 domain-containing protein [Muribaculaceae bacterium]